jgi:oligopeptidase B
MATPVAPTGASPTAPPVAQPVTPPIAKVVRTSETLHGDLRTDDYAWLRNKENPEVIAYLEAENAYTTAMTRHTKALENTLYDEMLSRIKEDDTQVPARKHDWFYYSRTEKGKAYPIFCRKRGSLDAREEVYFDQNAAAEGHAFYQIGAFELSPDHNLLALLVDTSGYEDFVLQVKDLRTGAMLDDRVEPLSFGLAWAGDSRTLFYVTTDAAKRGNQVWRHRLGDQRAQGAAATFTGSERQDDASVFMDPDVLFNVSVTLSRSEAHIFITSGSFTSGETWLLDANAPDAAPRVVAARAPNVEYDVAHAGDWLYIVTNRDGARNFKVMRAPVASPGAWEEWLPHRDDVFVEGVDVFETFIAVTERRNGLRTLRLTDFPAGDTHYVEFPEPAYGVTVNENPDFHSREFRFTYSSLVTPNSVYDYDPVRRTRELRKRDEVPGYDAALYQTDRLMVQARDGVRVPVSLVYRKPLAKNATRPLLLYAYGAYGYTMEPTFSSTRFSLVDRGFVYAIAHVRGGQEMGRAWYDDGKMRKKTNTFYDFIDCAEYIVRERYTSRDRLVANGASAGGLLMGAIVNMAPDLFHTVVADVPFVDVINTMLDASIPLTAQEWEQWGNPQHRGDYAYLRTYSPYDNVERRAYPRLLVTSGITDSRVAFWEPAKWVAKLRALKTDSNPLLLKMNMGAGHGGSSGRYEKLREQAFRFAFIIDQTGPSVPPASVGAAADPSPGPREEARP